MNRIVRLFSFAAFLMVGPPAPATAGEPGNWSISGFGTAAAARSNRNDLIFRSSILQDSGARKEFSAAPDSALGVQANFSLNPDLTASLQGVSRQWTGESYAPHITLAMLRYQLLPDLSLRVGRTRLPFFMLSDSLNLNYANPWVRPPVEVYTLGVFADLDGIDALYSTSVGAVDVEMQVFGGRSNIDIPDGNAKLRQARGAKLGLSYGGLSLQFTHTAARLDLFWGDPGFTRLVSALQASPFAAVANDLRGSGSPVQFSSAGFQWEESNWLVIGEYARRKVDRFISSNHGWYLSAAYRLGNFQPFVTVARQGMDAPTSNAAIPVPALAAGLETFNASRNSAGNSVGVGLRWEASRNIALKGQVERFHAASQGRSIFRPDAVTQEIRGPITVISLSMDFLF